MMNFFYNLAPSKIHTRAKLVALSVLAAVVAALVLYAGVALAAPINEVELNDSFGQAQNIDGSFSLDFDPNIGDRRINTSTVIPHATVNATGNNTLDYYSFTVSQAGLRGIFDVDGAWPSFDAHLALYDSSGRLLTEGCYSNISDGQGGSVGSDSVFSEDPYMEFTFPALGTYYVAVSVFPQRPIPSGTSYQLQASLATTTCAAPTHEAQAGQPVQGGELQDIMLGSAGADELFGSVGQDTICGRDGADKLYGGQDADYIFGDDGNDLIFGGTDSDFLDGGAGDDRIRGDKGSDAGDGGEGDDTVYGGPGDDRLEGDDGNDTIMDTEGNNEIDGGRGFDTCSPGAAKRVNC